LGAKVNKGIEIKMWKSVKRREKNKSAYNDVFELGIKKKC
jgi:hypothetical protein